MRRIVQAMLACFLLVGWVLPAQAAVEVVPGKVGIGLNFAGDKVTVVGSAPEGSEVYVEVLSPPVKVPVNELGRVGPFWLNKEKVEIKGVPKFYQVYTSCPLDQLPTALREELEGYSKAFRAAQVYDTTGENKRLLSSQEAQPFLQFLAQEYQSKGLYAVRAGAVKLEGGRFQVTVEVPPGTPQGNIQVTAHLLKNGQVIARETTSFQVESQGLVRWLRVLAGTDGPVYGGLAVMLAIVAGLAVGMGFGMLDRLLGIGRRRYPSPRA
ncbi:TIGR02186 family protein [Desulfothermobacter acidiphilus]|uniref:TIGR02186 family protein n=1 Tax=Desulfothermobacter acidiphilus TaxID=1938353 RepID=UPI003F88A2F7